MDRAKVNPERSVGDTAPVPAPAAAPASAVQARARQIARRGAHAVGRVLEQVSKIYGYSFLVSAIDGIFISGISLLPLTNWDGEGVPRADVFVVSLTLGVWGSLTHAFLCTFGAASNYQSAKYAKYHWQVLLVAVLFANLCILGVTFVIPPTALGVNPKFYLLDVLGLMVGGVFSTVFGVMVFLMKLKRDGHSIPQSGGSPSGNDDENTEEVSAFRTCRSLSNIIIVAMLVLGYPAVVLPFYRAETTSDWARFTIVCVFHPVAQEFILIQLRQSDTAGLTEANDPSSMALTETKAAMFVEEFLVMYRRMMLGGMRDPTATIFAIVVNGLEEALVRCTIVYRDELWRWLCGLPEPTKAECESTRLVQGASVAQAMHVEVTCIITSRLIYMMMRPHRFAFNFGYGFDESDENMTGIAFLFASLFLELGLEIAVDSAAIEIERRHGIELDSFWESWHTSPGNFFGYHVLLSLHAAFFSFWAFSNLPSPFFCTDSLDPCSCKGGGFQIFKTFCDAAEEEKTIFNAGNISNTTSNGTTVTIENNKTLDFAKAAAKNEYVGLFDALEGSIAAIAVSIAVIFIIFLVFLVARSFLDTAEARRERDEADREKNRIELEKLELLEQNEKIQKDLALHALDEKQIEIVHAGAAALEVTVPPRFKIPSKNITFQALLGSGSFGDCYKGYFFNVAVAVKKMRVGLINEEGFQAYAKEVMVLATVKHENIVGFSGYSLEPSLLIVMEFVDGGTLTNYISSVDPMRLPAFATQMNILIGSAKAFRYLHSMEPLPILHRDIKSENILLTKDLEPRVADLGEARVMAENRTMTVVGTNGYTAPEVLMGEHYGTAADVFSFAIVMSEVVTLQPPYKDMIDGDSSVSMGQIVKMTQPPTNIRPTLPDELDKALKSLIFDCWNVEQSLRPSMEVIVMRLRMMVEAQRDSLNVDRFKTLVVDNDNDQKEADAISLCKDIHSTLCNTKPGLWDEGAAAQFTSEDTTVTACDPILNDIVKGERGTNAIRSCGGLMFGSMEDGSEVIADPLLAQDILVDLEGCKALLTMRFSASAAKTEKQAVPSFQARKEFKLLLENALAEEVGAHKGEMTPLAAAVDKGGSGDQGAMRRKVRKRRSRMRTKRRGKPKKGSVEETFDSFVRAARFVRYGDGVRVLHPSAKLRLFGLMCQAQNGDLPSDEIYDGSTSSASRGGLDEMKQKAWASQKGKTQKAAMEEYLKTLSDIAPHWRIAHLVAGRTSAQGDISKPRRMMWVLSVAFRERKVASPLRVSSSSALDAEGAAMKSTLEITSLKILQGANASQAREWFEAKVPKSRAPKIKDKDESQKGGAIGAIEVVDADPFIANLPTNLTVGDLIVDVGGDVGKFKTMKDQNAYFVAKMLKMAREGHDDEDGWTFKSRVQPEGVDVYERKVEWSPVAQLRSRWTASCSVEKVAEYLTSEDSYQYKQLAEDATQKAAESAEKGQINLYTNKGDGVLLSKMAYMTIELPWPLSNRDLCYTTVYLLADADTPSAERAFVGYTFTSDKLPQRPGMVRATIKYQGYVVVPLTDSTKGGTEKCRVTWLCNLNFGGSIPSITTNLSLLRYMVMPQTTAKGAEAWTGGSGGEAGPRAGAESRGSVDLADLGDQAEVGKLKRMLEEKDKDHERTIAEKDEQLKKKVAELAVKDEELRSKDVELKRAVSEIMELRRRLPREDNSNF